MNLCVAWVSEPSTLAVALESSRTVAAHSICRKEVCVTVTAGTDNYCVGSEALYLTCNKVTCDDTACTTVDDDNVKHLVTCIQLNGTLVYLVVECRVCTEKKLLTGLAAGIECTRYLSTAE